MWAANSGDKSPAVQNSSRWPGRTELRASVWTARALAPLCAPRGNEVTAWDGGHFHFGIRVECTWQPRARPENELPNKVTFAIERKNVSCFDPV